MKEIINFNSKFNKLEMLNPLITKYRLSLCLADVPANKYIFSKEVINSMSTTVCGSGVYAYYFDKLEQIGGHESDLVKTSRGYVRTGKPIPYGFIDPYKMPYWMEIDGENWFCADCYIWTSRNPEIADILENQVVMQSMEVVANEEPDERGNKIVTEALFLGSCLLQGIDPAYPNSQITKFSLDEISSKIDNLTLELNLLKQEYEQFSSQNQNQNQLDLQVENELESVQLSSNEDNLDTNELDTLNITKEFFNNQEKEVNEEVNKENVENLDLDKTKQEVVQMSEEIKTEEMSTEEVDCTEQTEEVTASSNENVDNAAMEALNEKSAEDNKELAEENLENPEEVNTSEVGLSESEDKDTIIMSMKQEMSDLQEKFSKMESDLEAYINENTKLKEFKASIEKQNKEFAVETTLTEVLSILSSEEIDSCRLSSEKFSLDDIDIWKNEVKAKAFNFSKGIPEKKPFIQVAFPTSDKPKSGTGLWD